MRQGVFIYDEAQGRMDIRFGLEEYYGGLHCGQCMEVMINDRWVPTRIEYSWDDAVWFLVDIETESLVGLRVRR